MARALPSKLDLARGASTFGGWSAASPAHTSLLSLVPGGWVSSQIPSMPAESAAINKKLSKHASLHLHYLSLNYWGLFHTPCLLSSYLIFNLWKSCWQGSLYFLPFLPLILPNPCSSFSIFFITFKNLSAYCLGYLQYGPYNLF